MVDFSARNRQSYVEIPDGLENELPSGISLELLLIEVRQALRQTAFPFSIRPRAFDLALDEALTVVRLTEEGYSDAAAWWIAREASVSNCVDSIPEPI